MNVAAGQWIKYDPKGTFPIPFGEWCLFSMEIDGQRNTFAGVLFEYDDEVWVGWDGFGNHSINDTLYYARVSPPKVE